jgi:hypothetical protein
MKMIRAIIFGMALLVSAFPAFGREKHPMTHFRAVIGSIEHKTQRYDTVGDWHIEPDGGVLVVVSRMSDQHYEFLVALHELIEAYLCKHAGISEEDVTWYDREFESKRRAILSVLEVLLATADNAEATAVIQRRRSETEAAEPGDDPRAPYHKQHVFASKIERMVADQLGVDWAAYNAEVESK